MPKALGRRMTNHLRKTLITTTAIAAVVVGWVAGAFIDPPIMVFKTMMGVGAVGMIYFSLRPLLRPRHSHSSLPLPLFPVLVVA